MKKTLSICLALVLALAVSLSAFAADAPSKDSVKKELDSTFAYLSSEISGYTADSAVDYYYLVKASGNAKTFYDGFLESVKANLDANGGKLVTAYGENISSYAAVIGIIDAMGDDPTDVNSVNLVELFEKLDNKEVSNPYYYNIVIPVASKYCDEAFVKSLCDSFIESNYTMGSGMNYWGFACDNTAMFISAVAQSGFDCYDAVLADAINVIDTYKTDGGYCYNPEYGTAPNVNSTALALMAKCAYYTYKGTVSENLSELTGLYNALLTFKGETEGSYTYDGAESKYSAADAIKGLSAYYITLPESTPDSPDVTPGKPDTKPDVTPGKPDTKPDVTPDKPDAKPDVTPDKPDAKPDVTPDKPDAKPNVGNNGETNKNPDIPNTDGESSVLSAAGISLGVIVLTAFATKKKEQAD